MSLTGFPIIQPPVWLDWRVRVTHWCIRAIYCWPYCLSQEILPHKRLSDGVIELITKSWRNSTESAYSSAWYLWDSWCLRQGIDPLSAPLMDILEFLMIQFQIGIQYRIISTLTHNEIDGVWVGQHPLVSCLLNGVFNSRPPALQYLSTWDVSGVFAYLESIILLFENKEFILQALTHKVAILLALIM